jgi:hypothetical protein
MIEFNQFKFSIMNDHMIEHELFNALRDICAIWYSGLLNTIKITNHIITWHQEYS